MAEAPLAERPLCAEASAGVGEPVGATASRVQHWLLVEYGGYWPYDPLDATVFAGSLRTHLEAQLARLRHSRLLLVRRPGRVRREHIRIFYGTTPERGARFHALELERHTDLAGLDLAGALLGEAPPAGEPLEHPLLLVCTHGKRDRCCALFGVALCEAAHAWRHPNWVWQASHVGGDRFAGNLVSIPEGLYFGRLAPADVQRALDDYVAGRIDLDHYRGRSCYPFAVQAAELEVRRSTGLVGFHDLRLLEGRRTGPNTWLVLLLAELSGEVHEVEVGLELGDEMFLTCRAEQPRQARRFVATAHRVR